MTTIVRGLYCGETTLGVTVVCFVWGALFELHIPAGLTALSLILFRLDLNFRLRYPIEANHRRYCPV